MHTYIHYMRKYMHACMHSGSLTPERLQSLQDRSEAPWMALPVECKTVIAHLQAAPLVFIPTCRHTYIHTYIFSVVLISTYAGYIQVRMRRYAWHTYLSTHTHTHIYISLHKYIRTFIHTCVHRYRHTYIHTYTHTLHA